MSQQHFHANDPISLPISLRKQRRTPLRAKTGCKLCRLRKIKCDEGRPICTKCKIFLRNPSPCVYEIHAMKDNQSSYVHQDLGSHMQEQVPLALTISPPNAANLTTPPLAQRLFYHFVTDLPRQLPQAHNAIHLRLWTNDAPQFSFQHDYILSAVLGISALHIGLTYDSNQTMWLHMAAGYLNRCMSSFRTEVCNIHSENALPIILTGMLINGLSSCLNRTPDAAFEPPVRQLRILKGIRTLIQAGAKWLHPDDLAALASRQAAPGAETWPRYSWLSPSHAVDFRILLTGLDPQSHEHAVYAHHIKPLSELQSCLINGATQPELQRLLTVIAVETQDEFVEMLQRHDPRAIVIASYHSAMGRPVSGSWWSRGLAKRLTDGYASLVPLEWRWALVWPQWFVDCEEPPQSCDLP